MKGCGLAQKADLLKATATSNHQLEHVLKGTHHVRKLDVAVFFLWLCVGLGRHNDFEPEQQ
jgi:hypothetical protein